MSLELLRLSGGVKVTSTPDEPFESEGLKCKDRSLARQSEADGCDVNKIVARYEKTGVLPLSERQALFVDVSEVGDYRTMVERVRGVEAYFASLPAKVRARFGNAPAEFLDFMTDDRNVAEAQELGLLPKTAAEEPPEKTEPVKA